VKKWIDEIVEGLKDEMLEWWKDGKIRRWEGGVVEEWETRRRKEGYSGYECEKRCDI